MSVRPGWPWLSMAAGGSIIVIAALAATGHKSALTIVAQAFAFAVIAAAVAINAPAWRNPAPPIEPADALGRTTRLTALVYGWSGLSMFAIYLLTPLRWQHGWQYGLAMLLVALGNLAYARRLDVAGSGQGLASRESVSLAVQLAALQGIAALGALLWLIASGKLDTMKGDWAANGIFLAGGLAIIIISAVIVKTHAALTAPRPSAKS